MAVDSEFREPLLKAIPSLRAFAISLCGDADRADDLVQDTLLRALANIDRFELGTNLNAWLFTILRNLFHSEYRKRRREVEDVDGAYSRHLMTPPDQDSHLDFEDLRAALASCLRISAKLCFWLEHPVSPTKKLPRFAIALSAPSKAGLIAPVHG